ncbi:hypothetical protein OMCYN_00125 [cyanobiont of Ornithocercus magnificus]|nr:hypothetical protein OMCYN_00125 [cyanobiont of Ornithocercus magnificus]
MRPCGARGVGRGDGDRGGEGLLLRLSAPASLGEGRTGWVSFDCCAVLAILGERPASGGLLGCTERTGAGRTGGIGGTAVGLPLEETGACSWGELVFLTDRIASPVGGLGLFAVEAPLEDESVVSNPRIRRASSSLIELLWLFAVIESRSAASSTSLFSRPRSLDSS